MKMKHISYITLLAVSLLILYQCEEAKDTLDDAAKVAALKDVDFSYDSLGYELDLPEGASSGKSFDDLMEEDSATYANPENYTISFAANMNADNTKDDARDAKFDGMELDIVMDTISSSPIRTKAVAFEIPKGETKDVTAKNEINLKTHRLPGKYIFQQIVAGDDLATTLSPTLLYDIGSKSGDFDLPDIPKDIPTRASADTKEFLRGLLESGVLDAPEE